MFTFCDHVIDGRVPAKRLGLNADKPKRRQPERRQDLTHRLETGLAVK